VTWERITAQARTEVAENPRYGFESMVRAMDEGLALQATARPEPTATAFERVAERSYRQLPSTRARALGLPPRVNRVRRWPRRIATLAVPSSTAILAVPPGAEHQRVWRRRVRVARVRAYWAVRPGTLPRSVRRAHGRPLLEELSQLAILQQHGARAVRSGAGSPFALRAHERAGTLSVVLNEDGSAPVDSELFPADLGWVSGLWLDLADPWLVPAGVGPARSLRLDALSWLIQERPDIGRRLLIGREPWCAVVRA
jgi:hypothetical protein